MKVNSMKRKKKKWLKKLLYTKKKTKNFTHVFKTLFDLLTTFLIPPVFLVTRNYYGSLEPLSSLSFLKPCI